MHIGMKLNLAN